LVFILFLSLVVESLDAIHRYNPAATKKGRRKPVHADDPTCFSTVLAGLNPLAIQGTLLPYMLGS
jgi:hypothetical protein